MADCHFCGSQLIWQNDYDAEDYGFEYEGIVAVLICPNCEATWTGTSLVGVDGEVL